MFVEYGFKTPEEFYDKKDLIRNEYKTWSYCRKFMYKTYVYSRDMLVVQKNTIWEYLNEPEDSEYYVKACFDLISFNWKRRKK